GKKPSGHLNRATLAAAGCLGNVDEGIRETCRLACSRAIPAALGSAAIGSLARNRRNRQLARCALRPPRCISSPFPPGTAQTAQPTDCIAQPGFERGTA